MKCNHPKESSACSFHYNGLCLRNHNYECPALIRRKGKWLWGDGVRCSHCNHKLQTTGLPSYCPNCGADIREEKTNG